MLLGMVYLVIPECCTSRELWAMYVMSEVMICVMTRYVGLDRRRVTMLDERSRCSVEDSTSNMPATPVMPWAATSCTRSARL